MYSRYVVFAKTYPFLNNVFIATIKTQAADLTTQMGVEGKSFSEIDWRRNIVFMLFGCLYLGGFQYLYQINIFQRIFPNMARFTEQTWRQKLADKAGLKSLVGQVALDNSVLATVYIPTFYVLKSFIFTGSTDVTTIFKTAFTNLKQNWARDAFVQCRLWIPLDFLCFSIPLYLRLPVRHVLSFFWTAYFSFLRGANKPVT